jgi:hypothetical protein
MRTLLLVLALAAAGQNAGFLSKAAPPPILADRGVSRIALLPGFL